MGDALLEVLGGEARRHIDVRRIDGFAQGLELGVPDLTLHFPHRPWRDLGRQHSGVGHHLAFKLGEGDDTVDQAHLARLPGADLAGREQQVRRPGDADEARQEPAYAVLGHQSSPGEGGGEDGGVRSEADVGVEGDDEAEAGAGAIDGGDDRLGRGRKVGIGLGETGVGARRRRLFPRDSVSPARLDALQPLHVGAGAEASSGAGEHDHPHRFVVDGRLHCGLHLGLHGSGPRVEAVGPVEGDHRDAVLRGIEYLLVGHGCALFRLRSGSRSIVAQRADASIPEGSLDRSDDDYRGPG